MISRHWRACTTTIATGNDKTRLAGVTKIHHQSIRGAVVNPARNFAGSSLPRTLAHVHGHAQCGCAAAYLVGTYRHVFPGRLFA